MHSTIGASGEEFAQSIARADITTARRMDSVLDDLGRTQAVMAQGVRQLAARVADEFPADSSISSYLGQYSAVLTKLAADLVELRRIFRRAHAHEWSRIETPRRNEQAWDFVQNQD